MPKQNQLVAVSLENNQKGFSVVEVIIVMASVVLIGLVGYLIYKNQHKSFGPVTGRWVTYSNAAGNFSVLSPTSSYSPTVIPQSTHSDNGVNFTLTLLYSRIVMGNMRLFT